MASNLTPAKMDSFRTWLRSLSRDGLTQVAELLDEVVAEKAIQRRAPSDHVGTFGTL